MRKLWKKMKNKQGFTLMEMLIVVAIIAVLVAIAIPVYQGQVHKAKVAADMANVRAYYAELQADYLTTGEYLDIKYMDEPGFDWTQIPAHGNSTNIKLQAGWYTVRKNAASGGYEVAYGCNSGHESHHFVLGENNAAMT